jgi:hypothetical protein
MQGGTYTVLGQSVRVPRTPPPHFHLASLGMHLNYGKSVSLITLHINCYMSVLNIGKFQIWKKSPVYF